MLANKARHVRIVPMYGDEPPLIIEPDGLEFQMRREMIVRQSAFQRKKTGTLVVEAAQPGPLYLRAIDTIEEPPTAFTTILLRFDPEDTEVAPPRLSSLSSKLKSYTFFSTRAARDFPAKTGTASDRFGGLDSRSLSLAKRSVANVQWQKHDPLKPEPVRPDFDWSVMAPSLAPAPSGDYKHNIYYTGMILAPITLPQHKVFVPTFHSCLISRDYRIKFDLFLDGASSVGAIGLRVPIQVSYGRHDRAAIALSRNDSIGADTLASSGIEARHPGTSPVHASEPNGPSRTTDDRQAQLQGMLMSDSPDYI
jgi:hypothetical protein